MQLVQVRQYLTQQLPGVKDNDSLTKGIAHHHAVALNLLRAKSLVIADATRGLKVLESGRLRGFMNANADALYWRNQIPTKMSCRKYCRQSRRVEVPFGQSPWTAFRKDRQRSITANTSSNEWKQCGS